MPEIGATLREARMRAHIDITEIERETKIRAKYLRALENEEWDLLPGSTYVKSFLRSYAEALGLDARLLVEEYKLRHERLSDVELQPITSLPSRDRRRQQPRGIPRGWVIAGVFAALIALLALLGSWGGGGGGGSGNGSKPSKNRIATTPGTGGKAKTKPGSKTPTAHARPSFVRLQLVPLGPGPVYVCLEGAGSRRLVPALNLAPGSKQPTYRSSRFTMTFGNGLIEMRVNGRALQVPDVSAGIGYVVTPAGRKTLVKARWPTCGA